MHVLKDGFFGDYILMLFIGFSKLMLFIEKQAKLFFFISKILFKFDYHLSN